MYMVGNKLLELWPLLKDPPVYVLEELLTNHREMNHRWCRNKTKTQRWKWVFFVEIMASDMTYIFSPSLPPCGGENMCFCTSARMMKAYMTLHQHSTMGDCKGLALLDGSPSLLHSCWDRVSCHAEDSYLIHRNEEHRALLRSAGLHSPPQIYGMIFRPGLLGLPPRQCIYIQRDRWICQESPWIYHHFPFLID